MAISQDAPAFLVGCKADLVSPADLTELTAELKSLATSAGFDGSYVVSARDDKGGWPHAYCKEEPI